MMTVLAAVALWCLLPVQSAGLQPAPPVTEGALLTYVDTPLRIAYQCSDEDMQASGLHCTEDEPCSVYLELVAVEQVGARVFVAGNLHTGSLTLQSVLLASADTGKSWSEPFERLRGASLDRIQFFDYETGWVAGQVVQPLPRDPFLLLTTDGGATWRRRPVFSESRPGAIELLQFGSRTQGTLWIDRTRSGQSGALYERYETTTGGESWVLREATSRPPPAAAAEPAIQPVWRLRADAKSRSYRLERAQQGGWRPVAAFAFLAGECRPVLSPPPKPPELEPGPAPSKTAPARKKR